MRKYIRAGKEHISRKTEKLRFEMRKAIVGAIVAAFGVLIALVWKDVVKDFVDKIVAAMNIPESAAYYHLISAIIITIVCVIGIIIVGRFSIQDQD
ncbi:hypothetical protein KY331_01755 [Candidatus Woesearchaeota archaeon]|nr:hypothetical protein [Candidatus Woesearchaeota archaeon]